MAGTAAGTTLAISAALPASQNVAGYAALSFTEINGLDKIGTFGSTPSKVTFTPLKGATQKHKGSVDYGALGPTMAHDEDDAGQALLRTAADDQLGEYSFRVAYPDGAKRYFQGKVFGYQEAVEGAENMLMGSTTIEINTPIVPAPAA
ncbi:hypothetical protein [Sphingomonas mucosissima]|uniref:Phage tail protein n=1 Tax=Sphingomonas mucosissima TaxID=370959 RepID=A0A245ZRD3_9SPHN|nr:hypothetical protein [Sphingomonas mucosissima]OWK32297.1 hypothetical protein SPMU_06190 [Sphingomonas mucosissima]